MLFLYLTAKKLREHWDEAFRNVNRRKNLLDDMLLECRQFDELYAEFERWLSQIEEELDARPIRPQSPNDVDRLLKEHKVAKFMILSILFICRK